MFDKIRAKVALLNIVLSVKKLIDWVASNRKDTKMGYSIAKGLTKAFVTWATLSGGILATQSGVANLSLPDTLSEFTGNWPNIIVPIVVAIGKFTWNYYKVNYKKDTTGETNG